MRGRRPQRRATTSDLPAVSRRRVLRRHLGPAERHRGRPPRGSKCPTCSTRHRPSASRHPRALRKAHGNNRGRLRPNAPGLGGWRRPAPASDITSVSSQAWQRRRRRLKKGDSVASIPCPQAWASRGRGRRRAASIPITRAPEAACCWTTASISSTWCCGSGAAQQGQIFAHSRRESARGGSTLELWLASGATGVIRCSHRRSLPTSSVSRATRDSSSSIRTTTRS